VAPTSAPRDSALVGRPWTEADTPALLVDLARLERNIADMAALARDAGVALRPHFKTHKSVAIARRQIGAGAVGMTVAKLDEAAALIDGGVTDILLANEIVTAPKLARAIDLARRSRLILAVDCVEGARTLSDAASAAGISMRVSIEVECGLLRCGVAPTAAAPLALAIAGLPGLVLEGVFTHAGNSYASTSREQVEAAAIAEAGAVRDAAEAIRSVGLDVPVVSAGSTPTARRVVGEPGITELRAGNYVFCDAMQVALGTVDMDATALSIAATVISRPTPHRAVIDAGSKTFGLDKGAHGLMVVTTYGHAIGIDGTLDRLSEEHGIFTVLPESSAAVGDRVRVLPNHACAVGNLGREYFGVRDGIIEEVIPIDAAGGVH